MLPSNLLLLWVQPAILISPVQGDASVHLNADARRWEPWAWGCWRRGCLGGEGRDTPRVVAPPPTAVLSRLGNQSLRCQVARLQAKKVLDASLISHLGWAQGPVARMFRAVSVRDLTSAWRDLECRAACSAHSCPGRILRMSGWDPSPSQILPSTPGPGASLKKNSRTLFARCIL